MSEQTAYRAQASHASPMTDAQILIVDDEPGMRHFLSKTLEPRCKRVEVASSAAEATDLLDQSHFDLILIDNIMPSKTGLKWLEEQRHVGLFADAILMTAYADLETAIAALRIGVADFLLKPFRANQILNAVTTALDRKALRRENRLLRHALGASSQGPRLLGKSPALSEVRHMLQRLAGVPTSVLFTGASGTGKEVAARTLHAMSDRADAPFVSVNCAALSPDTMERTLFGQLERDDNRSDGLFLHADGGTLFLDEVAEMPESVQAALLRVLEDKRIRPKGAERDIPLDLRFFFATNVDLKSAVEAGRFRDDLYHRINVVQVEMPRLKERSEDIVELAALFLGEFSQELGMPPLELDEETLLNMRRYEWPGNVRELRNMIERSVILGAFPPEIAGEGKIKGASAMDTLELVTQRHIMHVLDACGGNRAEAARRLGVSRKTVDRKLADWGRA